MKFMHPDPPAQGRQKNNSACNLLYYKSSNFANPVQSPDRAIVPDLVFGRNKKTGGRWEIGGRRKLKLVEKTISTGINSTGTKRARLCA